MSREEGYRERKCKMLKILHHHQSCGSKAAELLTIFQYFVSIFSKNKIPFGLDLGKVHLQVFYTDEKAMWHTKEGRNITLSI